MTGIFKDNECNFSKKTKIITAIDKENKDNDGNFQG